MVNYANGKIYKIVCNVTGKQYIGSTTKKYLCDRLSSHVCKYKMWKNEKHHYVSSFAVVESGNYNIILVEKCPCTSKEELYARERHFIESLECVNMMIPGRTEKEWREANKESIQEKCRQYREEHKIQLQQNQREKIVCECGVGYSRSNKARHLKSKQHLNA